MGVSDIALAADIEEEQVGGDEQHVYHGPEDAEDKHPVHLGLLQALAAYQELVHFPLLLVEDLGDLHAGEVFGQVGVYIRPGVVDRAVDMAGELLEDDGKDHQERHKAQHHQRQGVVQNQHGRQHADDHQRVFCQRHQNIGEQVTDGVGIVGDSRHQLAHGNLVQLGVGQLLNVGKGVQTDLGQNFLAGLLQDHGLEIGADHGHSQDARVHGDQRIEPGKLKALLDGALDVRHQQGGHHVIGNGHQHNEEHQNKILFVGPGIAQQPSDDLAVGHMPLAGLRFGFPLQHGIGCQKQDRKHTDDGADDQKGKILTH